ncbi:MAG: M2 family metallopeptidase [Deltaproteobacteria bacterium]|nr:M2 family metallopeptidase [Deltaproteobacteria bacterium]
MKRIAIVMVVLAASCQAPPPPDSVPCPKEPEVAEEVAPTAEDAAKFMKELETELLDLWIVREQSEWVKATHITHDTDLLAARANEAVMEFVGRKAEEAKRFAGLKLDDVLKRKFDLFKLSLSLPAPSDDAERKELAKIASDIESMYGKGKYCPDGEENKCRDLGELSATLGKSRDFDELVDAWQGWRTVSIPMREKFVRFVELANKGAKEMGFDDLGTLWKSRYDMPPDAFEAELTRLWNQVRPLYEQLHCFMRAKLGEKYGTDKVPADGPIPAHLLGNMWSQEWANLFDLVTPEKATAFDLTKVLVKKGLDEKGVVKQAEAFFVSLGLEPLPETFWERSMFVKPRDREVVCHASAWDIDWKDDLRIKMCIKIDAEDFTTVHHELGHNYYQRAYKHQPALFTNSANDGFHEALGDVLALSVTPKYLVKIGYIDKEPPDSLNPLMARALEKIAFLPFGLVVDKWRFDVFSGKVKPDDYNAHWWKLRTEFQGIVPPVERTEAHFDPGAKYHVPANVPYTRYFLAAILQFQFHRALCKVAGHEGPLHSCSIYGNKEVGKRLDDMMKMGVEKPWPEALKTLTGEDKMDATAIIDYFKPLLVWLKEQNKDATCGW